MATPRPTARRAPQTGVDFSDDAIALLQLGVRFIRSNVYELPDALEEQFQNLRTLRSSRYLGSPA